MDTAHGGPSAGGQVPPRLEAQEGEAWGEASGLGRCYQKWGPAARGAKANKVARLVEGKVCFIVEAGNWGWGVEEWGGRQTRIQRPAPHTDNQRARAFIDGGRVLHAETAQSALTVILKLVTR